VPVNIGMAAKKGAVTPKNEATAIIKKKNKIRLEHNLEDTKFSCTIIIATGIEVKYTKNENNTF
jgi:hypothetical protein